MSVERFQGVIIDLEHDHLRLTVEEAAALVRCNAGEDVEAIVDTCFDNVFEGVRVVVGWHDGVIVPRDVVDQVAALLAKGDV